MKPKRKPKLTKRTIQRRAIMEAKLQDATTLRPLWSDALDKISTVIRVEWGPRCERFEAGCACCLAWAIFDQIENITDGSALDDPDEFKRAMER